MLLVIHPKICTFVPVYADSVDQVEEPLRIPFLFYDIHVNKWKVASNYSNFDSDWNVLLESDSAELAFLPVVTAQQTRPLSWKCKIFGSESAIVDVVIDECTKAKGLHHHFINAVLLL